MAFRKKAAVISACKPDILIIQECEHPDKLCREIGTSAHDDILWFGNNRNKGLAVLSYGDFRLSVLDIHNEELRMIVPIAVTGGAFDFTLFAVWAYNPADPDGCYIEQIWKAIHYYESILTNKKTVLAGDFNSNTIWDKKRRAGNHSNVVQLLKAKEIFSVYHVHHNQVQGNETHPTLYLYRHKNKPYHIDYCFISVDMIQHIKSVEIDEYDFWTKYSDHVPLIITFGNLLA